jgi:hypothetical protein
MISYSTKCESCSKTVTLEATTDIEIRELQSKINKPLECGECKLKYFDYC